VRKYAASPSDTNADEKWLSIGKMGRLHSS
jgi:hypothetical protein